MKANDYRRSKKSSFPRMIGIMAFIFQSGLSISQQPNIIFLLADDMRWDAMSCAGNQVLNTPGLDELAAHGIRFENTFVTTSICCISRASILTGQYERRLKIT